VAAAVVTQPTAATLSSGADPASYLSLFLPLLLPLLLPLPLPLPPLLPLSSGEDRRGVTSPGATRAVESLGETCSHVETSVSAGRCRQSPQPRAGRSSQSRVSLLFSVSWFSIRVYLRDLRFLLPAFELSRFSICANLCDLWAVSSGGPSYSPCNAFSSASGVLQLARTPRSSTLTSVAPTTCNTSRRVQPAQAPVAITSTVSRHRLTG